MLNEVFKLLKGRGIKKQEVKNSLGLELNMNYICKDTIKQRKALYGNNFKEIAILMSLYLEKEVSEKDVAMNLAILKEVRIRFIKNKLQLLKNDINFDTFFIQKQIEQLRNGLEDSLKDFHNYLWIALNYEEYEKL